MAHNGMYLSITRLACIVALCASGCSAVHGHSDSGTVAHSIDSGVAEAGAKPLDAAERADASGGRVAVDASSEPPAGGDEDGGARVEQPLSGGAAAALMRCSFTPTGEAESTTFDVPSDVRGARAGNFWALSDACVAGGWDLAHCAGQTAKVTSVHTDQVTTWGPDSRYIAHVIEHDDFVCCVTLSVEGMTVTGGPPAAQCGPAYTARAAMQRCNIIEYPGDSAQTVEEVSVPSTFSDVIWRERASICHDGKYDLAKCAGKRATLVSINENSILEGPDAKRAWILSHESEVCCIWETDGAEPPKLLARECTAQ